MSTNGTFARRNIVVVASEIIRERGSQDLQIVDVAERARVDVGTIEGYFDSRSQLVAEAQMSNYFAMVEPLHLVLSRVETALAEQDEAAYWAAVEENMMMAWSSGQVNDKWGIVKLLLDVWSDPFSQRHFCDLLDIQFARWVAVAEGAKQLGWIDQDIDAKALTAVFWSASVGQVITAGSAFLDLPAQDVRDFYMRVVRAKVQTGPPPLS